MRPWAARGFTLLELLASMVIISILISLAVLSIGDPRPQRLKLAAEQLQAVTKLAQDQALFNAEELGIAFWKSGYRFVRLDRDQWLTVGDNDALRPRDLPTDVNCSLYLDGLQSRLPPKPIPDKTPKFAPQVFLTSSGELTPFELRLDDTGGQRLSLLADALGNLKLETGTTKR